jgi:hypothetical protein
MVLKAHKLRQEYLYSISIDVADVEVGVRYTTPRTYGVYEITSAKNSGRKFRFGNHPVRQNELIREHGKVVFIALFTNRSDAHELAALKNEQGSNPARVGCTA